MTVPLRVAVMGCVVNGPGEAREADLGVASGNGKGQIFVKGEVIKTVPEAQIVETLIEEAMRIAEAMQVDAGDALGRAGRQRRLTGASRPATRTRAAHAAAARSSTTRDERGRARGCWPTDPVADVRRWPAGSRPPGTDRGALGAELWGFGRAASSTRSASPAPT